MIHMQLYSLEIRSVHNSERPVSHSSLFLFVSSREKWGTEAPLAHLSTPLILLWQKVCLYMISSAYTHSLLLWAPSHGLARKSYLSKTKQTKAV